MVVTSFVPPRRIGALLFVSIAALLAGACTRSHDPQLTLACQMRPCVCLSVKPGVFGPGKSTDVLFKPNGDAYCPKDYVLRTSGK